MDIDIRKNGAQILAVLTGELDHHSAAKTRQMLDEAVSTVRAPELTLDMNGVTFMDSSGLGVVLGRYRTVTQRGGRLYIGGASRTAEKILRMAGVYSLVEKRG